MGKGDKKTRRGKIYRGTYGKARPKRRAGQRKAQGARTPAATGPGARGSAGGGPGATRAR